MQRMHCLFNQMVSLWGKGTKKKSRATLLSQLNNSVVCFFSFVCIFTSSWAAHMKLLCGENLWSTMLLKGSLNKQLLIISQPYQNNISATYFKNPEQLIFPSTENLSWVCACESFLFVVGMESGNSVEKIFLLIVLPALWYFTFCCKVCM